MLQRYGYNNHLDRLGVGSLSSGSSLSSQANEGNEHNECNEQGACGEEQAQIDQFSF